MATVLPALVLLATLAGGCGTGDDPTAGPTASESTGAGSTPAATASDPGSDTGSDPGSTGPARRPGSAVTRRHPAVLEVVPADKARIRPCRAQPRAGLVCAGRRSLRFQPEKVRRLRVVRVEASDQQGAGWVVTLRFARAAARTLAAVTTAASRTGQQVVVMVPRGRRVLLAARVPEPIRSGNVQVSGGFGRRQADRVVMLVTRTAG